MAIIQPAHGRWLVRFLVAALLLLAAGTVAPAQDRFGSRVIRGQSPIGNYYRYPQRYPQSVQSDRHLLFADASPPWIKASQDLEAPPQTFNAEPSNMMNQEPYDPGVPQPFSGGAPEIINPILPWGFMNSPPIWQPYASLQGNIGNDRSMGFGQLMIPLYQNGQSLIFADVRGRFADNSSTEGNFGLAWRTMVDPTWIFGAYGFYDHKRTENDNTFNQATLGMEALSVYYEARVNGYFPESGAKRANKITTAEFDNGTIFVRGGFERAYYGVDAEVGALLFEGYAGNVELRGFVGGYYFDTSASGFPTVAGPKGRLELRAYDVPWFGPESRVTFGVELQHDSVRDTQVAGIARLEIPLGFFSGARRLNRLERRMLDRIVRDDDIITVAQRSNPEVGRDSLTGRLLNNVTLVNGNTMGLPGVVEAAGMLMVPDGKNGSTVVVDGRLGPITSNNIVVQSGQVFRGGGFQVIGGNDPGAMTTFGTRPTIINSDATNLLDTVILKDYTTVADLDLTFTGGRHGIFSGTATDLIGVRVSGNNVSGSVNGSGMLFDGALICSTVSGNAANNNFGDGIFVSSMAAGSTVSGNTAKDNSDDGIEIFSMSGGTVSGNTANDNSYGIYIPTMSGGTVSGNTANDNINEGILFSTMSGGTVSRNTANNNGASGMYFDNITGGNVSGNTANNNGTDGIVIFNSMSGGTVSGNTANNNGDYGINIISMSDGTVSGNTANNNGINGISIRPMSGGTVSGNSANNNFGFGFIFGDADTTPIAGMVCDNFANNNAKGGYLFDSRIDGAGTITGNFATANGFSSDTSANVLTANGFSLIYDNAGTFTNNTATKNRLHGFAGNGDMSFTNAATGVFSFNTANQNGDRGYRFNPNAGTAVMNNGSFNAGTPPGNTFP